MRSRLKLTPVTSIAVLLVIAAGLLLGPTATGSIRIPQDFRVEFIPEGKPVPNVPFHVRVRITPRIQFCRPFNVAYSTRKGGLTLVAAPTTQHSADSGQSFETAITVQCIPNDTAMVTITFGCVSQSGGWLTDWWFASDDTSVTVQRQVPSSNPKPKTDPRDVIKKRFHKEVQQDTARYRRIDQTQQQVQRVPTTLRIPAQVKRPPDTAAITAKPKK